MASFAQSSAPQKLPPRIGRFEPRSVLGRGGQGVVYLAHDPRLGREVALKTLTRGRRNAATLLSEARNVARLEHPNIVPLYEIDCVEDVPYLVYQYADGRPLSTLLREAEPLAVHRAVKLTMQLLDGIDYAHAQGILHRDLSPANVLVDDADRPRILDFGVSTLLTTATADGNIVGTVNYLPPECVSNGTVGAHSDVYALGVILYEMLSGRRLFSADSALAVIYKITHERVLAPSVFNPSVDQHLDAIVLQAIAREPTERYPSAAAFKAALDTYLNPAPSAASPHGKHSDAVVFLLRKVARKPDFPAVSRLIAEINQKSGRPESDDVTELSNVILKDYALTSKLLRLVNSAVYGQYGGTISTVSRAVLILGFDAIRAAALSIAVFEHLKNGSQADALKDAACSSFLSAVLAKELGGSMPGVDPEEAFIGAMFHRLGRHLAIYYLPDEFDEIRAMMAQRGIAESAAAREVLGTGYAEFGLAVARVWNFPDKLKLALTPQREGRLPAPVSPDARNAQVAAFANEVAEEIAQSRDQTDLETRLARVRARYAAGVEMESGALHDTVSRAVEATRSYANVLTVDVQSSEFFKRVTERLQSKTAPPTISAGGGGNDPRSDAPAAADGREEEDRKAVLLNAVTEITNALLEQAPINQIFAMVIEAFYRGIEFSHVLLMLRDPKRHLVQARLGFGADIDTILPKFGFKTDDAPDIFNEAVRKGRDYVVLDVDAEQYLARIPGWCRLLTNPRSVMLFPLLANKSCIGLIYADKVDERLSVGAQELKLLNTLIKQASLAFNQRR